MQASLSSMIGDGIHRTLLRPIENENLEVDYDKVRDVVFGLQVSVPS